MERNRSLPFVRDFSDRICENITKDIRAEEKRKGLLHLEYGEKIVAREYKFILPCRLNIGDERLVKKLLSNLGENRYNEWKDSESYQLFLLEPKQKIFCGWYGFSLHWPDHYKFFVDKIGVLRYSLKSPQENSIIDITFYRNRREISSRIKRRKLDEQAYEIYDEIKRKLFE